MSAPAIPGMHLLGLPLAALAQRAAQHVAMRFIPNMPHSMKPQYVGEKQETLRYQKFQPWEVPVQFDEESCWFRMSELFC